MHTHVYIHMCVSPHIRGYTHIHKQHIQVSVWYVCLSVLCVCVCMWFIKSYDFIEQLHSVFYF